MEKAKGKSTFSRWFESKNEMVSIYIQKSTFTLFLSKTLKTQILQMIPANFS